MTQEALDLIDDDKVFGLPEPVKPFWPDVVAMLAIAGIVVVFSLVVPS